MGFDATIKDQKTIDISLLGFEPRETLLIPQNHLWYVQSDGWSSVRTLIQDLPIEEKMRRFVENEENIFALFQELIRLDFRRYPLLACHFGNSPLYTFKGAETWSRNVRRREDLFQAEKVYLAKSQFMHPLYKG